MTTELREALNAVARRFRSVRLWSLLAACCLAWAVIGTGLAFAIASTSEGVLPEYLLLGSFLTLTLATALVCGFVALRSARPALGRSPDRGRTSRARHRTARGPRSRLGRARRPARVLAIGGDPECPGPPASPRLGRDRADLDGSRRRSVAAVVAFTALFIVATMLIGQNRSRAVALAEIAHAADGIEVQVDPGDTSIERGSPLLVVARFQGAVPPDARLVVEDAVKGVASRAMTRSLEDPPSPAGSTRSRPTSPTTSITRAEAARRSRSPSSNTPSCNGPTPSSSSPRIPRSSPRPWKISAT